MLRNDIFFLFLACGIFSSQEVLMSARILVIEDDEGITQISTPGIGL